MEDGVVRASALLRALIVLLIIWALPVRGELWESPRCPSALADHVIIISIDGLRPDALQMAEPVNLRALWEAGAYSWSAQTVHPSSTLPAHASMVSGVTVEKHGVRWNGYEPRRGFIRVPTIFSLAHQAGLSTAAVVGKIKLLHLTPPDVVDFIDNPSPVAVAEEVAASAATYFAAHRPSLMFVHFADPDVAGHRYGWLSGHQLESIRRVDRALTLLLDVLKKDDRSTRTLLIITADHGGHRRQHGSYHIDDMTIPWILVGPSVRANVLLERPVRVYDTAAMALFALGLPVPEEWDGEPILEPLERASITGRTIDRRVLPLGVAHPDDRPPPSLASGAIIPHWPPSPGEVAGVP